MSQQNNQQQNQKGGGGGAKDGVTLLGNYSAANMDNTNLGNFIIAQGANATGFLIGALGTFVSYRIFKKIGLKFGIIKEAPPRGGQYNPQQQKPQQPQQSKEEVPAIVEDKNAATETTETKAEGDKPKLEITVTKK